jgi:hypothetical protein
LYSTEIVSPDATVVLPGFGGCVQPLSRIAVAMIARINGLPIFKILRRLGFNCFGCLKSQ